MNLACTCALLAAVSVVALPAFSQTAAPAQNESAQSQMAPSGSYSSLRDNLANQSEVLSGDVMTQRAILKKNQELLKEAQRLDAANKKMLAEKQHMLQQNAELERQRAALAQTQAAQVQSQPAAQPQGADVTIAKASTAEHQITASNR